MVAAAAWPGTFDGGAAAVAGSVTLDRAAIVTRLTIITTVTAAATSTSRRITALVLSFLGFLRTSGAY
ncbi:hypothetical protein ACFQ1L_21850 [Phytohabitans flavus]|uniref:hypothetical protein n=1 Tax=Phytohabitans flavus TaxID=1076124 RepID=UPI003635B5A0